MLDRYILRRFLVIFIVVNAVFAGAVVFYALAEVLIAFKRKDLRTLLDYTLSLSVYVFFYALPISVFVSSSILLRRLFSKKLDLIIQSFGASPLRALRSLFVFVSLLVFTNLLLSLNFYPSVKKTLFQIEKEYKKRQEYESLILRDFWFRLEEDGARRFVNFKLVDLSEGTIYGAMLIEVKDGRIVRLIKSAEGVWHKNDMLLRSALVEDFTLGSREVKDMGFPMVDIREVRGIGDKAEHLSMADLITLYTATKEIGLNAHIYLYEMVNRLTVAFFPLLSTCISLGLLMGYRSFKLPSLYFLFMVFYFLMVVNFQRLMAERLGINPFYSLAFALPLVALSLKSLYDLGKGFRV